MGQLDLLPRSASVRTTLVQDKCPSTSAAPNQHFSVVKKRPRVYLSSGDEFGLDTRRGFHSEGRRGGEITSSTTKIFFSQNRWPSHPGSNGSSNSILPLVLIYVLELS